MQKIKNKYAIKYIKKSLCFTCALHLSISTALYAHFELDDINIETHTIHYNNLPSVEENDALLKTSPHFNSFLKEAEEIVTRYELESAIGLRLIHRHFTLGEGQVMAEEYKTIDGVPSLVTSAHKIEEAETKGAVPASWIFSANSEDEVLLFEASNDSAVKYSSLKLQQSPEFFEEMCKVLTENNLHKLLSVALLKRDSLIAEENQIYMEVNSLHAHKSLVQIWNKSNLPESRIRTSWSFKGPQERDCLQSTWCFPLPNYSGHNIIPYHRVVQ